MAPVVADEARDPTPIGFACSEAVVSRGKRAFDELAKRKCVGHWRGRLRDSMAGSRAHFDTESARGHRQLLADRRAPCECRVAWGPSVAAEPQAEPRP